MERKRTVGYLLAVIACGAFLPVFAGNPFVWWDGNADPSIRIFNGRAYLYPSHDSSEYVTTWLENDFKAYSSSDLVHWNDHGVILSERTVTWDNNSHNCWAPDMHYYNGYYYFYFCIRRSANGAMAMGVARSTSPVSGFSDYRGDYLAENIDPTCFTDDDGEKIPDLWSARRGRVWRKLFCPCAARGRHEELYRNACGHVPAFGHQHDGSCMDY